MMVEQMMRFRFGIGFIVLSMLMSCSGMEQSEYKKVRRQNEKREFVYRESGSSRFELPPVTKQTREQYPWEQNFVGSHPRITREFFRCRGNPLNPVHVTLREEQEPMRHYDCGGRSDHSLPMRDGDEFIYPILIDLLNFLQQQTGMRVVVTCGHRCPKHNGYADPSKYNSTSKHMIAAEVDFYVQGMEEDPEAIVALLIEYYQRLPKDLSLPEYYTFERYDPDETNVRTAPWYNKEIFIKLFHKDEGRDVDNRHPYPYVSIQVRYDRDRRKRVHYSWEEAVHQYIRWGL